MSDKKARRLVDAVALWGADLRNVRRLARYLGVHASSWLRPEALVKETVAALAVRR